VIDNFILRYVFFSSFFSSFLPVFYMSHFHVIFFTDFLYFFLDTYIIYCIVNTETSRITSKNETTRIENIGKLYSRLSLQGHYCAFVVLALRDSFFPFSTLLPFHFTSNETYCSLLFWPLGTNCLELMTLF
jgi:hypothetical protein